MINQVQDLARTIAMSGGYMHEYGSRFTYDPGKSKIWTNDPVHINARTVTVSSDNGSSTTFDTYGHKQLIISLPNTTKWVRFSIDASDSSTADIHRFTISNYAYSAVAIQFEFSYDGIYNLVMIPGTTFYTYDQAYAPIACKVDLEQYIYDTLLNNTGVVYFDSGDFTQWMVNQSGVTQYYRFELIDSTYRSVNYVQGQAVRFADLTTSYESTSSIS